MSKFSTQRHITFLKGVSEFFELHTDSQGHNFCQKHKVEHIGKTAYSIGIDLFLYETLKDEKYFDRAHRRAMRVVSRLFQIGDAFLYLPEGKKEGWNMSQRVIDAGAATDMLATFLLKVGPKIESSDYLKIESAIKKNAETYLTAAAVHKAPTNQRLWGATGLASAYRLFSEKKWEEALKESVKRSLLEMREDGSFPYVTEYEGYGMDSSANDVTPFYHSRHAAYLWHVFDILPGDHSDDISKLITSTDFLIGLYQADGIKNIQLETKHWYFLSPYEISSNSYDVYIFLRAFEYTGDEKYAYFAGRALSYLYEHQSQDGALLDHIGPDRNFQCKYFWNSNTSWLTRIFPLIEKLEGKEFSPKIPQTHHFKSSGIINVCKEEFAFMIRGSKSPRRVIMGPKIGGGSLIYFGTKDRNFSNTLNFRVSDYKNPGNFHLTKFRWRPNDWLCISLKDLKALLIYVQIELRAPDFYGVYQRTLVAIKETFSFFQHWSSMYPNEVEMNLGENQIEVSKAGLADRSGKLLVGYGLEKTYDFSGTTLAVCEKLNISTPIKNSRLVYIIPFGATNVKVESPNGWKIINQTVVFPGDSTMIKVAYHLE